MAFINLIIQQLGNCCAKALQLLDNYGQVFFPSFQFIMYGCYTLDLRKALFA